MMLYFISFLMTASYLLLNLYVGLVMENFKKCQQEVKEAKRREKKRQRCTEKEIQSKEWKKRG